MMGGIPSPLRGRWLAGRSSYQEHRRSTGFVEEPDLFPEHYGIRGPVNRAVRRTIQFTQRHVLGR
jgi:hypothetical protein